MQETQRQILHLILSAKEGISDQQIVEKLGKKLQEVRFHLDELSEGGFINLLSGSTFDDDFYLAVSLTPRGHMVFEKLISLDDKINSKSSKPQSYRSMPNNQYNIKAELVQITEQNFGEVIGKKYANDPQFKEALAEIIQILNNLKSQNQNATEAQAEDIIEAEFKEIQTNQPKKWQLLRRQLLNRERWFNGGKSALSEVAKHYVDSNVFYKAGLAFLDGFSADEEDI
ncbi:winged helix-turn-helix domain-containing protein [Anabaena sphaerica]|nr:helix-turn-helix domain-containing protein [Anabaena sphaerica]